MNWLKEILTPEQFKIYSIAFGVSTTLALGIYKLDRVVESQKVMRSEIKQLKSQVDFVAGQNRGKDLVMDQIAERLVSIEASLRK